MQENRKKILKRVLAVTFIVAALALVFRFHSPPDKIKNLTPLLAEIDQYRATNNVYPLSYASFQSFTQLTRQFRVYSGGRDPQGITWEPLDVSNHDFTVMVDTNGYEIFVPAGRMKLISFSSFAVWRFDSSARKWQKGRIHWSYAGSYWSID